MKGNRSCPHNEPECCRGPKLPTPWWDCSTEPPIPANRLLPGRPQPKNRPSGQRPCQTRHLIGQKKQVNYRLDPSLIEELQKASIDYSFRQGQKFSQNRIVELALREWLDANGPWQH